MIYIASPYSFSEGTPEENEKVREARYRAALEYCGRLMTEGVPCYSAIVHWHEVAKTFSLPKDAEFYERTNRHHLLTSTRVHLLTLPGWEQSTGVAKERRMAADNHIPVETIDPSPATIQEHTRLIQNAAN